MKRPANQGFTIIEILIVVTITSILFAGILTTYAQIQKILKTQSETASRGKQAEDFYRTLNLDLQNLVFEEYRKYFFVAEKKIIGGRRMDFLNFISGSIYSNPLMLQSRIRNITYFGEILPESGKIAIFRKEDMFADYTNKTVGIPVPVLEQVSEFRVEFSRNGDEWLDAWDLARMRGIPVYIRATIIYQETNDALSPERKLVLETSPGINIQ